MHFICKCNVILKFETKIPLGICIGFSLLCIATAEFNLIFIMLNIVCRAHFFRCANVNNAHQAMHKNWMDINRNIYEIPNSSIHLGKRKFCIKCNINYTCF